MLGSPQREGPGLEGEQIFSYMKMDREEERACVTPFPTRNLFGDPPEDCSLLVGEP